ncbi:MAG TPA: hypothetical protein VHN14_21555, partial [Kofleriaceae bacterium]|nr:hypothetical protein [Kofleriaceae bacterium]
TLPELTTALAGGELTFSAVRELTRVATPTTEASWLAAARGKNLRQIEELVADHRPGDRPDDPPDPEARTHAVRFELSAVRSAEVTSIADDGARAHVDAADNTRAHVDADDIEITSTRGHVDVADECTSSDILDRWIDNVFGARTITDVLS